MGVSIQVSLVRIAATLQLAKRIIEIIVCDSGATNESNFHSSYSKKILTMKLKEHSGVVKMTLGGSKSMPS
jgi:hypothetical protein